MPGRDGAGPAGSGGPGGRRAGGGRGGQRGQGSGGGVRPGSGPVGECLCPACGARLPHRQGVACRSLKCPQCDTVMVRA